MRSAYEVLGIPANASTAEVEDAYQKARGYYSPDRIVAGDDAAVDRFNEIRTAHALLRDPASRAAHDRKLAAPRPKARVAADPAPAPVVEHSALRKWMSIGLAVLVLLFAAGFTLSWQNAERRREVALAEKAAAALRAKEEQSRLDAQARDNAQRQAAAARAEAAERRLSEDSRALAYRQAAENARSDAAAVQMQRTAANEALRREAALAAEERRVQAQAQQRIAMDRQRVRELCMLNYRRPDC